MYRAYLPIALTTTDLMVCNKAAPEDMKYCNGFCQEFRMLIEFHNASSLCKKCRNLLELGKKKIMKEQISMEEFQKNPDIVYGIKSATTIQKTCTVCKVSKPILEFESKKRICRACRYIQASNRNANIDSFITEIEALKEDLVSLKSLVEKIPKDKLIRIITHFQVGRKATDLKATMVANVVEHFRRLMNPYLCRGGCGFQLQEQFKTCNDCVKVKTRTKRSLDDFKKNVLPEFLENLHIIENAQSYIYNKEELMVIARKLGLSPRQQHKRDEVIQQINDEIIRRSEEQKCEIIFEDEVFKPMTIELNGFIVSSRESDGFINATQMCKAGKTVFNKWYRLESTKILIEALKSECLDLDIELVESKKGGNHSGSWIHPDLAVQLAQWISPVFALQISKWTRELAITGHVRDGKRKTHREILDLQQKLIEEQKHRKIAENKHRQILYKRSYYKFQKGAVFYIVSDKDGASLKYKVGIDDVDINTRLAQYRTSIPAVRLEFLMYTSKNSLIEQTMLERYIEQRKRFLNHEWIYDIELEHIIQSVKTYVNFAGIEYTIDETIDKYNEC